MGKTEIDGDQVQDESLTGDDVQDGSLLKADLSAPLQTEIDGKTEKATLTTKGDMYVRNGTGPVRLGVLTDTFTLVADAASSVGMAWKRLLAAWVSYDPTSVVNNSPDLTGATTVQQANDALANRHHGKDYDFSQNDGPFDETAVVPTTVYSKNFTVNADPDSLYKLSWRALVYSNKSNTTGVVRFVVDAGLPSEIIVNTNLVTQLPTNFIGFDSGILLNGIRTLDLQLYRTAGNGIITAEDVSLDGVRVS